MPNVAAMPPLHGDGSAVSHQKGRVQTAKTCYGRRIMWSTRPIWHALLTVFQIAALVAFSIVGTGHSHVSVAHVENVAVATVAPVVEQAADQGGIVADNADPLSNEAVASPCGLCCCHSPSARWASYAVTVSWKPERLLAGFHVVLFDSLSPETLTEPPRSFA